MSTIAILMPHAEARAGATVGLRLAPRPASLAGATVGIVNNSWRCMDFIADELRALFVQQLGAQEVLEVRISSTQTLPEDALAMMAARCRAIVVGIGN